MRLIIIAFFVILISLGLGTISAYAQGNQESSGLSNGHLIAFGSFIASGIFYSASGWVKTIRNRIEGANNFDLHKLGKSVAIGIILGTGAFIWTEYQGESIIINDLHGFLAQVGINTSAILIIDKWLIGRNPQKDNALEFQDPNDEGLDNFSESDKSA